MPDKIFNLSDLGVFADKFNKIIDQYQVRTQKEQIFKLLSLVLLDQISSVDLAVQLSKTLKLDFRQSTDLAFSLKKEIIDKKNQLPFFKNSSASQFWTKDNPNLLADEFLEQYDYDLPDETLKKRFYGGIISWIKGIRDLNELKELLTRSRKIGGAEMPEEVWPELEEFLQKKAEAIKQSGANLSALISEAEAETAKLGIVTAKTESTEMEIDVPTSKTVPLSQTREDFTSGAVTINKLLEVKGVKQPPSRLPATASRPAMPAAANFVQDIIKEEEFLQSKEELPPPPPVAQSLPARPTPLPVKPSFTPPSYIPPKVEATSPAVKVQVEPLKFSPPPAINKPPQVTKPAPNESGRPKIEDVKFTASRVFGPLDELANFSLADFRRLAAEPQQAVAKIKDKLTLLEDESITKKIEGIRALKASPLYKAYADIMNKSMMQGQPLEQVISQVNSLNKAEFQAIMDLNKSLKY